MISGPVRTIRRARDLRRDMTLPEVKLWQVLRGRPEGVKFRRQHPAGSYILDFYADARKLCIEVDGENHGMGDRPERDAARDDWLALQGIQTLRIPARDVLNNLDGVSAMIVEAVQNASSPNGGGGPRSGGGVI